MFVLENRGLSERTEDRGHLTVKVDFSPLRYGKSLIYKEAFVFAKESYHIREIDY